MDWRMNGITFGLGLALCVTVGCSDKQNKPAESANVKIITLAPGDTNSEVSLEKANRKDYDGDLNCIATYAFMRKAAAKLSSTTDNQYEDGYRTYIDLTKTDADQLNLSMGQLQKDLGSSIEKFEGNLKSLPPERVDESLKQSIISCVNNARLANYQIANGKVVH